mmetsp:Transcript_76414/g.181759  ORF Transcript_76414/g.181759 Transcript_76414/m.181759 type:complete len:246 (-) Transcript_76414:95-832(-)
MAHHVVELLWWIVDEDINTADAVILAIQLLKVGRHELGHALLARGILESHFCPLLRLAHHRCADVAGRDKSAPLRERNGETASATSSVAHLLAIHLLVEPRQNAVHGLGMTNTNVLLHWVDVLCLAVDLLPSVEALVVEVFLHHRLVVDVTAFSSTQQEGKEGAGSHHASRQEYEGIGVLGSLSCMSSLSGEQQRRQRSNSCRNRLGFQLLSGSMLRCPRNESPGLEAGSQSNSCKHNQALCAKS